MKKTIIILIVLITSEIINAQGLNISASYIKKNYPTDYESTLKKHALEEWNSDFEMVVYEIINQADALIKLVAEFKSENTDIAFRAIQEWSIKGYESSNISKFRNIEIFELKELI